MSENDYGRECELRKTIERLRKELNDCLTDHPLDLKKIMERSTLLDKLIVKCMSCNIEECSYNKKLL